MSTWRNILQHYSDPAAYLTSEGRVFYASDAAAGDLVTGQTSFATTTPTFQLAVPVGNVAIPLMMRLFQSGTVAGAFISVQMEFDNAIRYSSSGTAETVLCARTGFGNGFLTTGSFAAVTFRSNPTATDAYGVRVAGYTLAQDVAPAEGAVQEILWTPTAGLDLLEGGVTGGTGASWNVYTYAASTGPTWQYTFKWAVIPQSWLT
jgi:hypothetical protein